MWERIRNYLWMPSNALPVQQIAIVGQRLSAAI